MEPIALPNGRRVGSPGHAVAEKCIEARLREIGCVPYRGDSFRLPYTVGRTDFVNLVGSIPAANPTRSRPLLVGAHYDSVINAPCADDNAAAVAIALAVGQMAADHRSLDRDVVIAIFDAEEPPHFHNAAMRSTRFHEDQMDERGVHAAIIMDLVGHNLSLPAGMILSRIPGLRWIPERFPSLAGKDWRLPFIHNLLFMTGAESHPALAAVVGKHRRPKGLKVVPTLNRYIGDMSDHGAFRKGGVPYLFLSCGHWMHYHQKTDTPDRLSYGKMAAITALVFSLLGDLDGMELRRTGTEQFNDTFELERECLRRGFGPLHGFVLRRFGLKEIRSREDMDAVVNGLTGLGL